LIYDLTCKKCKLNLEIYNDSPNYNDKSDDFNETMSINNYLNNMQYNIIFIKVYFLTKKID